MKEKGMAFSTEMTKAIIEGRKTQTRRLLKPQPTVDYFDGTRAYLNGRLEAKPRFQVGNVLYVKETWAQMFGRYVYKADINNPVEEKGVWKSSRYMPKAAARIFLRVKDIRVERLNDINLADCVEEGILLSDESLLLRHLKFRSRM